MSAAALLTHRRPLDPFRVVTDDGVYVDDVVEVRRLSPPIDPDAVCHPRWLFETWRRPSGMLAVHHRLDAADIDHRLAGLIHDGLFANGRAIGPDEFERVFAGVVLTASRSAGPTDAWESYYRNCLSAVGGSCDGHLQSHARVGELLAPGTMLDLGSNFGFLPLRLADRGRQVIASEIVPGSTELLATMAGRLGSAVTVVNADAARFPSPDRAVDNVVAVHLLEHLDPAAGDAVVNEAVRLAARRVIIVVPLEVTPNATWGHVRTVTTADLARWGRLSGYPWHVEQGADGWLIIDTTPDGNDPDGTVDQSRPFFVAT